MRLDEWVDLFASASSHRYRCKLCDRELFGESRRKHARRVHRARVELTQIVIGRAKYLVKAAAIVDADAVAQRQRRAASRARVVARMRKLLTAPQER